LWCIFSVLCHSFVHFWKDLFQCFSSICRVVVDFFSALSCICPLVVDFFQCFVMHLSTCGGFFPVLSHSFVHFWKDLFQCFSSICGEFFPVR
jgi:hypothetical protein